MDDAALDALFTEIVRRLLRMRRALAPVNFDELAGALLLDIDVAEMEAAGRSTSQPTAQDCAGKVVPFPVAPGVKGQGSCRPLKPPMPTEEE